MRGTVLLCACLLMWVASIAQNRTVSGKITDARDGSPLTGVTVKAKGQTNVVLSQQDGSFTITIPGNTKSLELSYVGYADIEVPVSDNMNIKMSASERNLNEVVVVGYGRTTKRSLTGAIAKVGSKDIENFPEPSFETAIQGKAAGVVVESGSGKVGQGIKIRIRGTSSISASSQPLYVVDGLPVISTSQSDVTNDPTNPLADINPNDIESIEVLKDASASAIYGARAANGVVLITTKKGRNNQKTTFELNTYYGVSNPARTRKFADAKQYVDLIEQAAINDATVDYNNGYGTFGTVYDNVDAAIADFKSWYESNILDAFALGTDWHKPEVNTDWQNILYDDNAPTKNIDLSASGGDAKTRFYVSGFYTDQQAVVINNHFYRYGGRMNLEHQATSNLSFGINLSVNRSQLNRVTNDNAFSTPGQLVAQLPISPVYDPQTGKLNGNTLYANGLFDAQFNSDKQSTWRTIGNAFANLNILPSLSFRSEFGADILNLYQEAFQGKQTQDGAGIGKANVVISQAVNFNTNNYFTYDHKFNNNNKLNAVIGMSYLQNDSRSTSANGENIPSDAIKNLSGTTLVTFANSTNNRYTFLSYFLRGNYSIADKYLFAASIRSDASSRFGPNNRYGWFPSLSAGWVLSEEKFMKNISFLNFLKLRGSWGVTGNAEIGESSFLALYGVSNYPDLPGYVPVSLGNSDLKWEKTKQTDLGLEFAVLNSRLSGEVDVYQKNTSDLLLNVNVPATTSYQSYLKNLGNMENKGIEVTLNSRNIDTKFKWTTSLNVAYNKNKVGDIGGQIIEAGFDLPQRAIAGEPIGVFFGQKFVGVDPQTGDALYQGEDGKPTSDYNSAARVALGKSNPDWTGGFTNTFSYAGFDFSIFFVFVTGNQIYNSGGTYMSAGFAGGFDNQTVDILNTWKKPGDITNVPRIGAFYGSGYQTSSRWLYDGDYIRLRNATLGYTLPKSIVQRIKITSARLYVSGTNLWTKTKYPGDPEVNTQTLGNIGGGQDFYTISQPKTITVGLNVRF